jgi:MFS family permease
MIFSISAVVIPLYGLFAGYSATQIGLLLSVPGVFQIILRMFTGVLSDRFGEKNMLAFTHSLSILSCAVFLFDLNFLMLAIFQMMIGTSRAFYWPTSQSYASRISNTESSAIIGRFHSFNEAGKICGIIFAGWAILNLGYITTFRLIAAIGLLGLLTVFVMKSIPLATGQRKKINNLGESYQTMFKIRPLQFALITAFTAGLLSTLTQSFFPIWLKGLGNSEGIISIMLTAYLVGSIIAGRFYAYILEKLNFPLLLQLTLGGIGIGFLLVAMVKGVITIFAVTFILGLFAGFVTVTYQVMVVNNSHESNRGLLYSFVGLGWGVSLLTGPILFGMLVDGLNITAAFGCLGALILLYAVFIKVIYGHFTNSYQEEQNASSF